MTHLSDDDIQAYLDGGATDPRVERHLQECRMCSDAVGFYRNLHAGLADTRTFPRPERLASRVASRLHLRRPRRRRLPSPEVALAAAGIFAALAATFVFLDMGPVIEALSRIHQGFLEYTFPLLEGTGGHGNGLRPSLTVVIWGLIVVICLGTLDHLLSRKLAGRPAAR